MAGRESLSRPTFCFAHNFTHAFVIEKSRYASSAEIDTHSAANDECFGMIDIDVLATHEAHREPSERSPFLVGLQRLVEVFGGHKFMVSRSRPVFKLCAGMTRADQFFTLGCHAHAGTPVWA